VEDPGGESGQVDHAAPRGHPRRRAVQDLGESLVEPAGAGQVDDEVAGSGVEHRAQVGDEDGDR
jgi:hypothetical protein